MNSSVLFQATVAPEGHRTVRHAGLPMALHLSLVPDRGGSGNDASQRQDACNK